jgi:hypothetical protein
VQNFLLARTTSFFVILRFLDVVYFVIFDVDPFIVVVVVVVFIFVVPASFFVLIPRLFVVVNM